MAGRKPSNPYATKMPRLWKMIPAILAGYKLPLSVTRPTTYVRD
jgi:hypothetical protein